MKFLVDNQLPTALAQYLRERGFDCQHVLEAGLGNCRTPALLAAFERSWPNIESCLKTGDRIIEIR